MKLLFVFLLVSSVCMGQAPVYYQATDTARVIPVSELTPLPVDAVVNVTGLTEAIEESVTPTEWAQQVINLTGGTAANITTGITGSRQFVTIKSHNPDVTFWVSVDGAAVIGTNGVPVHDWIKLNAPETVTVSVISAENLDISVIEGGN